MQRQSVSTRFIQVEVNDYKRLARNILVASITDYNVILARPLSVFPRSAEQTSQLRSRLAVLLSSASLVNRALLAKTKRTRLHRRPAPISAWRGRLISGQNL